MKNKKGSKAQQQVKIIQQQQQQAGKTREQLAKEKKREDEKKAAAAAEKMRKEEMALLTPIQQPKVPFGVDAKTMTCEFWRAGRCDKSAQRCKYAHSEEANRKTQKKDLYVDMREEDAEREKAEKEKDTMDRWDEEKLNKVISSKHGNPKTTTEKVCKFFLQAVEDGKYGWFWECPNGGEKCMYRHRLPPGFVLKRDRKLQEELEKANEISLEDFLEVERHKLGKDLTPVTKESFEAWKKSRVDKREAEEELVRSKKEKQAQMNKLAGLSGREMFELNPEAFEDDEDGDEGDDYDIRQYFNKDGDGWEQDRQSEQGDQGGISEDEDYEEHEEQQQPQDQPTPDAASSSRRGSAAPSEKLAKLDINEDAKDKAEETKS